MNQVALRDVGLTDTQLERTERLLWGWALSYSTGINRHAINQLTGQITCSPGARLMTDGIAQSFDMGKPQDIPYANPYSDECLIYANQVIKGMDKTHHKLYKALWAKYRWYEGMTDKEKAKRLCIHVSTYYRRLDRARLVFGELMDWGMVT